VSPDRSPDRSDPARERDRANAARTARAAEPVVPPRRQPQQARSQAKVAALLDAADAIVIDAGIDGLTTTLVAARAGVAVGSLYRYFDGVPALIEALAVRHTEAFALTLEHALDGRTFRRKRDAANAALDALIGYARANPGFRAIWHGAPALVGAAFDASADHMLAVVLGAMVADGLASEADPNLQLEAQIQWATASALILLAFRRDADGDPVVLAHLRHLFTIDIVTTDDVDLDRLDAEIDEPPSEQAEPSHLGSVATDLDPRIGPVVTLD
jgi:AcrR family transcriptional regulator